MEKRIFFLFILLLFSLTAFAQAIKDSTDLILSDGSRIEAYYLNPAQQEIRLKQSNQIEYSNELIDLGNGRTKWNLKFNRGNAPFMDELKVDIIGALSSTENKVTTQNFLIDFSDAKKQGYGIVIKQNGNTATITFSGIMAFGDLITIDPTIIDTTGNKIINYGNVLARNSTGHIWYVFAKSTTSAIMDIYVGKSTNAGVSFTTFNLTNNTDQNVALPHIDINSTNGLVISYERYPSTGAPQNNRQTFITTCSTGGCDAAAEFLADINVSQCAAGVACGNNSLSIDQNNTAHITYGDKTAGQLIYRKNTGYAGLAANWSTEEVALSGMGIGGIDFANNPSGAPDGTGVLVAKNGSGKKLAFVSSNQDRFQVAWYNGTLWQERLFLAQGEIDTPPAGFAGYDKNFYVVYAQNSSGAGSTPSTIHFRQCSQDANCSAVGNWSADLNISTRGNNHQLLSMMQAFDLNLYVIASPLPSAADANIYLYTRLPNGVWTTSTIADGNLLQNDANWTFNPLLRDKDYYGSTVANPSGVSGLNFFYLDYVYLTSNVSGGNPSTFVFDSNALGQLDNNGVSANFTSTQIQPLILSPFQNAIYDFNSTSTTSGTSVIRDLNWFVDGVNVKSALLTEDYNLHYTTFITPKDYNISLVIKSNSGGFVSQKDFNLSLGGPPSITLFDANATTSLSTSVISNIGNISMRCTTGNLTIDLNYKIQLNDVNVTNQLLDDNYTLHLASQPFVDGTNTIIYYCISTDGIDVKTKTISFYNKNFYFVFDHTGVALTSSTEYPLGDVNSVYVYSFDNNKFLNLISSAAVSWYASGDKNSAIQVRIGYEDVTFPFTTRDFHLSVLDQNVVPVCYSRLQTFYENVFYSSVERELILKNANTLCYQFAAKTKYAFGDSLAVTGFLVPQSYNLHLVEEGVKTLLAVVEGSSSGSINVDALILKKEFARELIITSEGATISKNCGSADCNTWTIRYKNTGSNNSKVIVTVYNGSTAQFSYTETSTPNDFDVSFSSTDLNFNAALLTLTSIVTRTNGDTKTFTVYFTPQGQVGFIHPLVALILSFIIFLGGITLVSMRLVFGWYGAAIAIIALALLSFSVGAWYIVFMQAVMLIMLAYIGSSTYRESLGAV